MMTEPCEQFQIRHHNSTPYRPQMNGAVEAANKNIKKIIRKMADFRANFHRSNPYSLVYGTEAILPIEVEIPSLRLEDAEWIQRRHDQLNLIEEKCLTVLCHGQLYQRRIKNAFDKKVNPRIYKTGDMVIKKVLPNASDSRGKWASNYEGPYVVKHAFSGGALVLTDAEGHDLKYPVNSDLVKMFFL
ncbi:hypothetical protein CR513_52272, partial [Mucuna pruriens]